MTLSTILFFSGLVILGLGVLGSMLPLWKSGTLSPASIERRVYWTGCGVGSALLFVSQLPDWRSGLFVSLAIGVALVITAFVFSSHIKIGGRIYALYHDRRRPDPPPALGPSDEA
jgi:hypothetical protein